MNYKKEDMILCIAKDQVSEKTLNYTSSPFPGSWCMGYRQNQRLKCYNFGMKKNKLY